MGRRRVTIDLLAAPRVERAPETTDETPRRIETAAARTEFENPESRDRFWRMLERMGIDDELRRQGAEPGTLVRIGRVELEWGDDE